MLTKEKLTNNTEGWVGIDSTEKHPLTLT